MPKAPKERDRFLKRTSIKLAGLFSSNSPKGGGGEVVYALLLEDLTNLLLEDGGQILLEQ